MESNFAVRRRPPTLQYNIQFMRKTDYTDFDRCSQETAQLAFIACTESSHCYDFDHLNLAPAENKASLCY